MESLTSPKYLKELLSRYGFHFSKSLGQNFLIDENILHKIVQGAGVTNQDNVLEIGPGVGTLTREIAKAAAKVAAVEIDSSLLPILDETLKGFDNARVFHGDILKLDISTLVKEAFGGETFKVVANLPYYITTPIIMRFLEEEQSFATMVVMIQKEVAERMAAKPGTKDYGALSVAVQFYTKPRIVGRVPASVFMPPPKVDSIVIALDKREAPAVDVNDRAFFFSIVKAVFSQRRKTLLNTLSAAQIVDMSKDQLKEKLQSINIDPQRRGETLSLEEFALMSNTLGASPRS